MPSENAIAECAIYRTLKESMVEDLVSRSSICITQHDPFDGRQRAHKGATAVKDELEGRKYVHDCVKILLKTVTQENIYVVVRARLTMI
jgi:hypothetical protein